MVLVGGHLPKKIYVFLIMMKYDDLYFASRYNFFTDCVEWYFLPKTEIKVFLKKMDIRGFGWRPSICWLNCNYQTMYLFPRLSGLTFLASDRVSCLPDSDLFRTLSARRQTCSNTKSFSSICSSFSAKRISN